MTLLRFDPWNFLIFVFGASIGCLIDSLVYRISRRMRSSSGKCTYSKTNRFSRILFVAVSLGSVAVLCVATEALPMAALFFAVACLLLTIALIDANTQEIPDSLNLILFVLGIISIWIWPEISLLSRILGIFAVSVPLFLLALFITGSFGMGDVKLMAAAGFVIGWQNALLALFIGLILGGVYGTILLATKKKRKSDHFAFGPCLTIGIFLSMFFGEQIIRIYLNLG